MQKRFSALYDRGVKYITLVVTPEKRSHLVTHSRQGYHFFIEHTRIHQALVVLTIFILINNSLIARAATQTPALPTDVIVSDPYVMADTVRLLSAYTPDIEEDPEAIAMSLEERVNGTFLSTNPLIATLPSESEEPNASPTPQPQKSSTPTVPQNRTKDIKYTVQIGDTLGGIGSKFDLKIATIKVKNNLSDIDSLKPGQELLIPVDDLSDKAIKAADDRQKASKQLADTKTKKTIIKATASGGYGLIVPIRHNGISRGLIPGVHTGIDYRANVGTPIMAAGDGVVVIADESGWNGGYGKTVLISHGGDKTTRYGHMSDVIVKSGQRVSQGELIGYSGNTGRSTGPHLHFELRVGGRAVSPF